MRENKDYKKVREQSLAKRIEILTQSEQQSYAPLMDLIGRNKDIQFMKIQSNEPSFEKQKQWVGSSEDINSDKFPEFVVRDDRRFIQSADGLRFTVQIWRQIVINYFSENPSKAEGQQKLYKQWKEEDKPAEGYRHFIKNYLSTFLKEYSYLLLKYIQSLEVRYERELLLQGYCKIMINHIKNNDLLKVMQQHLLYIEIKYNNKICKQLIFHNWLKLENRQLDDGFEMINQVKFLILQMMRVKEYLTFLMNQILKLQKRKDMRKEQKNSNNMNRVWQKQEQGKILNLVKK